jgi:hypothetical protein
MERLPLGATTERNQVDYKLLRADGKIKFKREYTHSSGRKARAKRERQNRKAGRK